MGYALLKGQQVALIELLFFLRLLTDEANFLHAYVEFNANDDFESNEFLSLFVCLLFIMHIESLAAAEEPLGDIFRIAISKKPNVQGKKQIYVTKLLTFFFDMRKTRP